MTVCDRLLLKLSDVINNYESAGIDAEVSLPETSHSPEDVTTAEIIARASLKAQAEWFSAIAAIEELLVGQIRSQQAQTSWCQGLVFSSPSSIFSHAEVIASVQTGIFTPKACQNLSFKRCQLPAAASPDDKHWGKMVELPLFPKDPLASEQFCLVFTSKFGLLMTLGENRLGVGAFAFSFEPEVLQHAWLTLRSRLFLTVNPQLPQFDALVEQFKPTIPDYRLVTQFSRCLLHHLSATLSTPERKTRLVQAFEAHSASEVATEQPLASESPDVELLQALTHEIRTPLTTIRTMVRLLMRRQDLTPEIAKPLEIIDSECSEQIDRMELIFRATELKTTPLQPKTSQLGPISLEQVFQRSIPRWKKQAQRRNVNLEVVVPQKLPTVVSDSAMLDRVLSGLIENFIRSLPSGGKIRIRVETAGHQLKLQFLTESAGQANPLKALGQLLMFQPATGILSLNLDATKHLFNALGGKLIVRQRSQQKEVFTIFLPLGTSAGKSKPF